MALTLCTTCGTYNANGEVISNRKQYHLLPKVCSGHSEVRYSTVSGKVIPPADPTKVLIPTYKAEVKPPYQPPVKTKTVISTGLLYKDSTKIDAMIGVSKSTILINDGFKCSFCDTKVDHTTMTRGVTKPRKVLSTEVDVVNGEIVLVEKIHHIPSKVIACPNCVLQITPVFNRCRFCKGKTDEEIRNCFACHGTKEGEMVSQGTIFPDYD